MVTRFNIIGFWPAASSPWRSSLHCVIHPGTRLVHMEGDEPNIFRCSECGSVGYTESEAITEEKINTMFGPGSSKPAIIQAKKQKKKYFDQQGNEVTDPEIIS